MVERVQPILHTQVDVLDMGAQVPGATGEQQEPDDHERDAVGGDVEDRQQTAVEHQRRTDVVQHDQREHRCPPEHKQRTQMLERGDRVAEDLRSRRQRLSVVTQVGGQEDHQPELSELGGLEGDPRKVNAQVGAVHLLAEVGHPRQQQQHQRGDHDEISVVLELAVVPQPEHGGGEQRQAQHEPLRLLSRQGGAVDAVDHHDAEAGQHGDQREDEGIGVRQRDADEDVPGQAQPEEQSAIDERDRRQLVGALYVDGSKAGR